MYHKLRPWLFRLDSETVHEFVVRTSLLLTRPTVVREVLYRLSRVADPCQVGGLSFPNRVGLAAGFDKNARWISVAEALGFGHVEVGAVTPRPQAGHPRPRVFRLPEHHALRNRMGFNNDGAEVIGQRLQAYRNHRVVVGVNLGKNSETPLADAAGDYLQVIQACKNGCDYFSLNVSSPNTEGLRELGQGDHLRQILSLVRPNCPQPLWLKLSPDEGEHYYQEAADLASEHGLAGLILANTSLRREGGLSQVDPQGGISGKPLLSGSVELVRRVRARHPKLPLMGVGGIFSGQDACAYLQAGADLVQLYTGMIYEGPSLPKRVAQALKEEARRAAR